MSEKGEEKEIQEGEGRKEEPERPEEPGVERKEGRGKGGGGNREEMRGEMNYKGEPLSGLEMDQPTQVCKQKTKAERS